MLETTSSGAARVEITEPKCFGTAAILTLYAFGLMRVIPVAIAVLAMTLLSFQLTSLLLPFGALAVTAYFLPFSFGNAFIKSLLRRQKAAGQGRAEEIIVQLTFNPRLRSGLRALLEDADDVGYLSFTDSGIVFQGDSIHLQVPFGRILQVRSRNIGMRALFMCGARLEVEIAELSNIHSVEIAERTSWTLPAARRVTRNLRTRLEARVREHNPSAF